MAALLSSNGGQFCGATLVSSKYVVTAAHCMFFDQDGKQPLSTSDVQVRLGDHDLSVTGETTIAEKTVAVAKINNHESYAPAGGSLNNDITVLELAEEVDLDTYPPACMAQVRSSVWCIMLLTLYLQTSDTETFYGKDALVYGWGTTSAGGSSSSVLLEVNIDISIQ